MAGSGAGSRRSPVPPGDFGSRIFPHATAWRDGVPRDPGTLLRDHDGASVARGINDVGQVVGRYEPPIRSEHNVRVSRATLRQDGAAIDLGTLRPGDAGFSDARAINRAGLIVGSAQATDRAFHATTRFGGGKVDLGIPAGFIQSVATAMNDRGDVVGFARATTSGRNRAYLWRAGAAIDLTATLPADSGWELLSATGINDRGQICGIGLFGGAQRAYLLDPDGSVTPSPSPSASPSPSPAISPTPAPTFGDVPTGYWAYRQIEVFATLGITTGCGTNEIGQRICCPDRGVTRAEMAARRSRMAGRGRRRRRAAMAARISPPGGP